MATLNINYRLIRSLYHNLREIERCRVRTTLRLRELSKAAISIDDNIKSELDEIINKESDIERRLKLLLAKKLNGIPVVEKWLQKIPGMTIEIEAGLISLIEPIKRFPNVAKLWAYSGLHTVPKRLPNGQIVLNPETKKPVMVAPRVRPGEKPKWSVHLKTLIVGSLARRWEKVGGPYKDLAMKYKERIRSRPNSRTLTELHLSRMAWRYAGKIFLSHLWEVWRSLEGLEIPSKHKISDQFNEEGYLWIDPWKFVHEEEEVIN